MSGRPTSGPSRGEWPPEWAEEAARLGSDPVIWAITPWGSLYVAVWQALRDVTPWEHGLAEARAPGQDWLPVPRDAVARVRALREARRQRPDLSDDTWQRLVHQVWAGLTEPQRSDPRAILAQLNAIRPTPRPRPPGGAPRLPEHQVRRDLKAALARLDAEGKERPTQERPTLEQIASAHSPELGVRGLQKRLAAYPHLRDLLPR